MQCIHAMDCYSAFKRKEILTASAMQKNLEDTMLSEITKKQIYDSTYIRFVE